MPLAHAEACSPTRAFGAYLRTIAIAQRPNPANESGCPAQSVGFPRVTAAARLVASADICSA